MEGLFKWKWSSKLAKKVSDVFFSIRFLFFGQVAYEWSPELGVNFKEMSYFGSWTACGCQKDTSARYFIKDTGDTEALRIITKSESNLEWAVYHSIEWIISINLVPSGVWTYLLPPGWEFTSLSGRENLFPAIGNKHHWPLPILRFFPPSIYIKRGQRQNRTRFCDFLAIFLPPMPASEWNSSAWFKEEQAARLLP